jgi:hypothetical protein
MHAHEPIYIGFRTVELVQETISGFDESAGLTFYFKVNNVPVFLKGTRHNLQMFCMCYEIKDQTGSRQIRLCLG